MKKVDQEKMIRRSLIFKIKEINEDKFTISGVFSTGGEDRHGEIIDQTGWKLDAFKENPVILFGHDQWTPSIGQAIKLEIDANGNLAGTIKFAVEEHDLAKTIFNLYKGRFMRAFSVGFQNNKFEVDEEKDMLILRENTLFEISCVNVPANAMALASTKGVDITPIKKAIQKSMKETQKKEAKKKKGKINLSKNSIKKISENLLKQIQEVIRNDNAKKNKKVETPNGKGVKRFASNKQLNKIIRQLIKEKKVNKL